jgi:hypothetical protein
MGFGCALANITRAYAKIITEINAVDLKSATTIDVAARSERKNEPNFPGGAVLDFCKAKPIRPEAFEKTKPFFSAPAFPGAAQSIARSRGSERVSTVGATKSACDRPNQIVLNALGGAIHLEKIEEDV